MKKAITLDTIEKMPEKYKAQIFGQLGSQLRQNKPAKPVTPELFAPEPKEVNAVKQNVAKPSKMRNKRVYVEGMKPFDSKAEYRRYGQLIQLERQGHIKDLQRQVSYELNQGGTFSYKYKADFVYIKDGKTVVEDVKGMSTAVYKKKKRLMKKVLGIEIQEIKVSHY
jgi:hypothetical protein